MAILEAFEDLAQANKARVDDAVIPFHQTSMLSYLFQTVMIDGTAYLMPDLDKIAHQLVDVIPVLKTTIDDV